MTEKIQNNTYKNPLHFSPSELGKKYGLDINDDSFCILPFMHMSTTTNGEYRLCCRSQPISQINYQQMHSLFPNQFPEDKKNTTSIKETFLSERYNNVRKQMIQGIKHKRCNACWKLEENNVVSLRKSMNLERLEKYIHLVKKFVDTGNLDWNVPVLEFKLSNICNLRCRMCSPKDSTPWIDDWKEVRHLYPEGAQVYYDNIIKANNLENKKILNLFSNDKIFVDDIMENLGNMHELEFAGGEPLLDPLHFEIISKIKNPENVILKYSTNLTNLEFKKGRNILDIWKQYKGIKLTISIDGYERLNKIIRKNSDWNILRENIKLCKKELGNKLLSVRGTTTISAMNVEYLLETMKAITEDLKISWHTSRLTMPAFLHANVLDKYHLQRVKRKYIDYLHNLNNNYDFYIQNNYSDIMFNSCIRHLKDSIAWIEHCITNNKEQEYNAKYKEFYKIMYNLDKKVS